MRYVPMLSSLLLLAACSETPKPDVGTTPAADTVVAAAVDWPGYYTGTLPCADCPGIATTLWVRTDSTFVLQRKYMDRDSVPFGTIGSWKVMDNDLVLGGQRAEAPLRWKPVAKGLEQLTVDGGSFAGSPHVIERLADAVGDAIPRMRLTGTFTYMADAQSFQPCGSTYNWPCVGGMDMGEEEGEPLVKFTNVDLQRAYLKAVKTGGDPWVVEVICTLGMGPAAEGDGADEYIYIEQVIGTAGERCP
ncbi:MAG: copper resistance protein NlpE N-terminal domain-containing protein [Flavobacteriales bacterium]|nr:copper resistance protein NlpE N-terminal domain-containing protein [Flavobacteriales bacterium]